MRNKSFSYKTEFLYILIFFKSNFLSHKFLFNKNLQKTPIFNFPTFLQSLFDIFFWAKIRVLYYVNNWIYTTNHKRIAVNYFWFVILAGIVGMVLATLIRLEFAYPGVGIFAGDSLQYLSMATAHGVIMVFFMIIPLLFGAFANFLIPTQLGVHDVAFPRLNSAAFWFLPGGLLMLCQLVCVDRRYQRMNCFNIREIQSILKRKFFTDLINTHDHHTLLDKTALGLRFKTNSINNINSNIFIFYNYGIEFAPKTRSNNYSLTNELLFNNVSSFKSNSFFYYLINTFNNSNLFFLLNNLYLFFINQLSYTSSFHFQFQTIFLFLFSLISSLYDNISNSLSDLTDIFDNFYDIPSVLINKWQTSDYSLVSILFAPSSTLPLHHISTIIAIMDFSSHSLNVILNFLNSLSLPSLFDISSSLNRGLQFNPFSYLNFNYFFIEFFFFIKFLEIFYYVNDKSTFNFSFIYNYFHFYQYFINFFMNVKLYFLGQPLNIVQNSKITVSEETINFFNSNESILIDKNVNNFKTTKTLFNDTFTSKLDYNSYFVYFYIIFYILYNLPFMVLAIFKNIFNANEIIKILFYYYEIITSWYIPVLLNDNVFYIIYKNLDFKMINIFNFNFMSLLNNFIYYFNSFYNLFFKSFNVTFLLSQIISYLNILLFNSFFYLSYFLSQVLNILNFILFSNQTNVFFKYMYQLFFFDKVNFSINNFSQDSLNYQSNYFTNSSNAFSNKYSNEENSNVSRYLRFYNPVFKYDYKSGDYFNKIYKEIYTSLFITKTELASTLKPASWFFSDKFNETFNDNFANFYDNITQSVNFSNFILHNLSSGRFNHTDAFYNFFYILANEPVGTNKKWISLNTLNQKFYRMFNTSSMQQRIYSNWRQLKFTREAWRCKLLAARHQKTLFRRYFHEDGVFWSIERNAKDLLPGWAMITPFSARTRFTAVGKTDIGLMGVFLVLNSSIISGANFLVTYRYLSTLNNRKMRDARVFFTESIIVACWMMIFANPMLAIAILMLLSDRHWQTSFFDYSGGGDTVLFQHMFWFFGHPEVYIVILPTFGFTNSMISYYLRKRVSARASLMYSMYTIAFLGFFVWGHHMYMVGLAHTTRMLFSTLTVMISVPAATKIMHWCVTTVNSAIAVELPLLFTFTFIFLFVSGGISGMCVAHTGMDILFHDTFYVIGHFHVMLAGSAMFASFGAFYFYFPAIFGVKYSRIFAYLHYVYYLLGQLMTVIPMFWLGYAGMPRRVLDYPASMGGWHSVISAGHMLSVAGLMAFFIMIFDSLRQGRAATRNTFGISRYNTRLNFYLYEIFRLTNAQQKGLTLFRFIKPASIKLNNLNYSNFEPYETTLITYTFSKK